MSWTRIKEVAHALITSLAVLSWIALFARSGYYHRYHSPIIHGVFDIECTLIFAMYSSPPSQPTSIVLGNTFSAITSVVVQKAFQQYPSFKPGSINGVN